MIQSYFETVFANETWPKQEKQRQAFDFLLGFS